MIRTMPELENNNDGTFNILVFGVVVERNVPIMQLGPLMRKHWPAPVRTTKKGRKTA